MATLGKIRNRSGLLLAVIGIAMLAFILGDFMQSKRSGGRTSLSLGEINGEEISIQLFEERVDQGINNWRTQNPQGILTQTLTGQIRNQVWNEYLKEILMNTEYLKLGISVSDDEFFELLQGVNVHPEISRVPAFQNEQGNFDRTRVLAYLKQIDQDPTGEARDRWVGFQRYLIELIKNSKYNSLVSKGLYVTSDHARIDFNEIKQNISFDFVRIPYSSIADSLVNPSNKEIKKYYSEKKSEYQQDASKDVDFIIFNVEPSNEDDVIARNELDNLKSQFSSSEDYNLMARRYSDDRNVKFNFSRVDAVKDTNFIKLLQDDERAVLGPYLINPSTYRIAMLAEVKYRPDSVEARHILISPNTSISVDSVQKKINKIKEMIVQGADFGRLAESESEDKGSALKGGDLGWFEEGEMVDEFNESCFNSNKGDLNIVTSQFGVHLIEVTNISRKVKKVKIAYIDRNITPSTQTFNKYYSDAAQFAGKILNKGISFDSLVAKENLIKRNDRRVKPDKPSIAGLPDSREMVRWVNNNDVGSLSEVFEFENMYVVGFITGSYEKGDVPLSQIEAQIRASLLQEKKFTYHNNQGNQYVNLEDIAISNSTTVVKAKKSSLTNLSIEGLGYEPELVGAIFGIPVGQVSGPIQGRNGIYYVNVTQKDDSVNEGDFSQQKKKIFKELETYSTNSIFKVLKNESNIVDNLVDIY